MALLKRYQVFLSSTYEDLQQERQRVIQALLELDCIPSGMELFPAADDEQWELIKKVINDCDYYIVIVGGRYGSLGKDGRSFTQMEYEYAVSIGKPVMAFLHKTPGQIAAAKTESSPEGRESLANFRKVAERKMCKYWTSAEELGSAVTVSMVKLINSKPAVGWVRGDLVADESASQEILRLRKKIDELQGAIKITQAASPPEAEDLAKGKEPVDLSFKVSVKQPTGFLTAEHKITSTWDDIFSVISPLMIDKASEQQLSGAIRDHFHKTIVDMEPEQQLFGQSSLLSADFQKLKLQFRALGLISKDTSAKSLKDTATYWTLTPYGDALMTRLNCAEK